MGKFFACVLLLCATSLAQAQQCVGNNCPLVHAITHPIQTVFGCTNCSVPTSSVRTESVCQQNNCQRPRLFWRRCR